MFMIELFWVTTYLSEVLQLVFDCLPYSPFQWPFHPNLGFWFLTSVIKLFSQFFLPNMFIRSRIIISRIFKFISFHLIGFWESWLLNYPLNFILSFPNLNLRDWHRTKRIPSLDVSWVNLSNIISIRWGNPKLLICQCRVPNLGINGGEGKWS